MTKIVKSTIRDVAAYAQVSVATVSRVLNGKRNVSSALRDRVLAAAEALEFRANRLAMSFRRKSTNFVALLVPDMKNLFFAALAHSIEEEAFRHGRTLFTCNTSDDLEREAKYIRLLSEEAVAGIVICTANEHRAYVEVNQALKRGMAVVAIDRRLENAPIDLVLSDNFGGARAAVAHLVELGHRRIGVIYGSDDFAPARERRLGYEQALRDHGVPLDAVLIKATNFRDTGAERATHELMALPDRPTAVFVCSGNQAPGTLRALGALSLRLPEDLSLVVFDDSEWVRAFHPPITAVEQDCRQIGMTAVKMLLRRIKEPDAPPEERRIPTRLHVRNSCLDLRLGQLHAVPRAETRRAKGTSEMV